MKRQRTFPRRHQHLGSWFHPLWLRVLSAENKRRRKMRFFLFWNFLSKGTCAPNNSVFKVWTRLLYPDIVHNKFILVGNILHHLFYSVDINSYIFLISVQTNKWSRICQYTESRTLKGTIVFSLKYWSIRYNKLQISFFWNW